LRTQTVKAAKSDGGLKRVVIRRANAVELNDRAKVGKGVVLVNVRNNIQLSCLTTNISKLHNCRLPESFLELQVIVSKVGHAEVLAYRKDILSCSVCAQGIATDLYSRKDGSSTGERTVPVVRVPGGCRNSGRSDGISLQTLRCSDRRAEVQE